MAIAAVRVLELEMFAKVVTESWVMFAPVKTLRELTFPVVMLADAVFSVRMLELNISSKVVTESLETFAL